MSLIALIVDIRQSTTWQEIKKRTPNAETTQRVLAFNTEFITRVRKYSGDNKIPTRSENFRAEWNLELKHMSGKTARNVLHLTATGYVKIDNREHAVRHSGVFFIAEDGKITFFVKSNDEFLGKYTLESIPSDFQYGLDVMNFVERILSNQPNLPNHSPLEVNHAVE